MYDWIIVVFVIGWAIFMVRRGGCCGGHSHKTSDKSMGNRSCCDVNSEEINKKQ